MTTDSCQLSLIGTTSTYSFAPTTKMGGSNEVEPALFQPLKVGDITLAHRVVLAPLTRCRANNKHVHTDIAVTYYAQRASTPGTLLITEATYVAPYSGHFSPHAPGVWSTEQVAAWKKVGPI